MKQMLKSVRALARAVVLMLAFVPFAEAAPKPVFAPGDLFVSFESSPVQWRNSDGSLNSVLASTVPGTGEGMAFDHSGHLYLAHWCADPSCSTGNTIEEFNARGVSEGAVGTGYDCNPHAVAFDQNGRMLVGQADCTGDILRMAMGSAPQAFTVAAENRGSFWIVLAPDNCTVFYTSWGPDVKRFNVCTGTQMTDFNQAPLPGGQTQGLQLLPDGGVLVSSGAVIARLNASGQLVQTYSVSTGEAQYWAGLDLVGDGTFWAVNYYSSNVYRFNLSTGAVVSGFNTGAAVDTAVDVRVVRSGPGLIGPLDLPLAWLHGPEAAKAVSAPAVPFDRDVFWRPGQH
jgi:outer membrane protein assembly factor BamB